MDIEKFDQRVLNIARKRLENIPNGFEDFERDFRGHGIHGSLGRISFLALEYNYKIAMAFGNFSEVDSTFQSLIDEWANCCPSTDINPLTDTMMLASTIEEKPVPVKRVLAGPAQDAAIDEALRTIGIELTDVERNGSGKPGQKAAVWKIARCEPPFTESSFKRAWGRLLKRSDAARELAK